MLNKLITWYNKKNYIKVDNPSKLVDILPKMSSETLSYMANRQNVMNYF